MIDLTQLQPVVTAHALADEFVRLLHIELTAQEFAAVQMRNARQRDIHICHSHDYLDANEVMAQAFENLHGREVGVQDENDSSLWRAAWCVARQGALKAA